MMIEKLTTISYMWYSLIASSTVVVLKVRYIRLLVILAVLRCIVFRDAPLRTRLDRVWEEIGMLLSWGMGVFIPPT